LAAADWRNFLKLTQKGPFSPLLNPFTSLFYTHHWNICDYFVAAFYMDYFTSGLGFVGGRNYARNKIQKSNNNASERGTFLNTIIGVRGYAIIAEEWVCWRAELYNV
jgi:hypothetical protein